MSFWMNKNNSATPIAGWFDKVVDTVLNKTSNNPVANAPVATKLESHENAISQLNSDLATKASASDLATLNTRTIGYNNFNSKYPITNGEITLSMVDIDKLYSVKFGDSSSYKGGIVLIIVGYPSLIVTDSTHNSCSFSIEGSMKNTKLKFNFTNGIAYVTQIC